MMIDNSTQIMLQGRFLLEMQKKNREQEKRIAELEEDVAFLKNALAIALNENGRSIVYREKEVSKAPTFSIEENMSGEMIVRLICI